MPNKMLRQRAGLNLALALTMLLTLGVSAAHGAPPPQEEMTYMVKPGDNLWTLAQIDQNEEGPQPLYTP
jgi:hypothetical protein